MALDLTLKITADATQAKAQLAQVEQGLQRVEQAARKGEPSLGDVAKQLGIVGAQGEKVVQSTQKVTQTTQAMGEEANRAAAKLLGLEKIYDANHASLARLDVAQAKLIATQAEGTASYLAMGAAAGVFAAAVVGIVAFLGKSTEAYITQSGILDAHKKSIDAVKDAWHDMFFEVGRAVVGGGADVNGFLGSVETGIRNVTGAVVGLVRWWKELRDMGGLSIFGIGGSLGLNSAAPSPYNAQIDENGQSTAEGYRVRQLARMGMAGNAPPGIAASDAERVFEEAERERVRAAKESLRAAIAVKRMWDDALTSAARYTIGITGGLPGQVSLASGLGFTPYDIPNVGYSLGLSSAPGLAYSGASGAGGLPTTKPGFWGSFGSGADMGRLVTSAVAGGGNIGGTLGSAFGGGIGNYFGQKAATSIGGKLGGFLGGALPVVGSLLGPLVSWIGGLLGPSQGHKDLMAGNAQIDAMKQQLLQTYGSMEALRAASRGLGVDIMGAWNSQNLAGAEHFKTLMDQLATKTAELNEKIATTKQKILDLGGNLPGQEGNTPSAALMAAAAGRYGITTDALGQGYQNSVAHDNWQQMIDDMDLLGRGGADMNAVLAGMSDEITGLVSQSKKFGTTIPENMRPWLQQMVNAGTLLDDNGEKIRDLSGLTFGATLQTTLDSLIDTLKELIATLGGVPAAAGAAGAALGAVVDVAPPRDKGAIGDYTPDAYHAGGLIRPWRIAHSGGLSDEFPVLAQRGEFMLRRSAVSRIGVGALTAMNNGSGLVTVPIVVNVDSHALLDIIAETTLR